ncbi:MAG: hypothetical protein M3R00_06310 [Pseudomonadota bacterium]|nr:hypothetical protein [Pseudomonadota bacterium]
MSSEESETSRLIKVEVRSKRNNNQRYQGDAAIEFDDLVEVARPITAPSPRLFSRMWSAFTNSKAYIWLGLFWALFFAAVGGWLIPGGPGFIVKFKFDLLTNPWEVNLILGAMIFCAVCGADEMWYSMSRNDTLAKTENDVNTLQKKVHKHLTNTKYNLKEIETQFVEYHTLVKCAQLMDSIHHSNYADAKKDSTLRLIERLSGNNELVLERYMKTVETVIALKNDLHYIPDIVGVCEQIMRKMGEERHVTESTYYTARLSFAKYFAASLFTAAGLGVGTGFGLINFLWLQVNALVYEIKSYPLIWSFIVGGGVVGTVMAGQHIKFKYDTFQNGRKMLLSVDKNIRTAEHHIRDIKELQFTINALIKELNPSKELGKVDSHYIPKTKMTFLSWYTRRNGLHVGEEFNMRTGPVGTSAMSARRSSAYQEIADSETWTEEDSEDGVVYRKKGAALN